MDIAGDDPDAGRSWTSLWTIDPSVADRGFATARREGRARFDTSRLAATTGVQWWSVTIFRMSADDATAPLWIVIANDISARIVGSAVGSPGDPTYRALVLGAQTMTWAAAPMER